MSDYSDSLEDFVQSFLRGNVHTAQPGEIVKVISVSPPIVNVQPAFMRLREGSDEPEKRPIIPNVPIIFPVFGDYGIVGAIQEGMTVLLIANERSIKPWIEQGGVVDPAIDRVFDLSDCIAIPGLPNKTTEWTVPSEGLQIGTVDGETILTISGGKITTKADETVLQEGEDYAVQFSKLKEGFDKLVEDHNKLVTAYLSHTHSGVMAGAGATGTFVPAGEPPVASTASIDSSKVDDVRVPGTKPA